MLTLKLWGAYAIGSLGLAMAVWALLCHRRRQVLPGSFFRLAAALAGVIALQALLGLVLLWRGHGVLWMHIVYGLATCAGGVLVGVLRPGTALGLRYRRRPLVHAGLGLAIFLVAVRAWMVA